MKSNTPARDRRDLLKLLVSAPIAATAVAAVAPAQAKVAAPAADNGVNYRETDHVKRYYASLRGQ